MADLPAQVVQHAATRDRLITGRSFLPWATPADDVERRARPASEDSMKREVFHGIFIATVDTFRRL